MVPSHVWIRVRYSGITITAGSMLQKLRLTSVVLMAGTAMFLSSCSGDEDKSFEATKPVKSSKKKKNADLDRLIFAPTELTLEEAKQKYVHTAPVDSIVLSTAAELAADKADNDAALKLATEAIRLDDKNANAYYQRGRARCNVVAGKDDDAIEDLKKAISLGRDDSNAHLILARLYDNNKQPQKAIESLTIAIKISPNGKDLYKSRAAIYASTGELEKALTDYKKLGELDPHSSATYYQRGQIFETLKKYEDAKKEYQHILKFEQKKLKVPLKGLAYKQLAALESAQGKHKNAIQYLTEAMKLDIDDDEPVRLRGLEYAKDQDFKNAIVDLDAAIDLAPDVAGNFLARAEVYSMMGKSELADKDRLEAKRLKEMPAERPIY